MQLGGLQKRNGMAELAVPNQFILVSPPLIRCKDMSQAVGQGSGFFGRFFWISLVFCVLTLGSLAGLGITGWLPFPNTRSSIATLPPEPELPDIENLPQNPGYLGIDACSPCHEDRVRKFKKTNHANAIRVPEAALMPGGFEPGKNTLLSQPGLEFEMKKEGNDFFSVAKFEGQDKKTSIIDSKKIDFVYGWGRLDEVNFSWDKDRLVELPVAWLFPQETWGITSAFRFGDSGGFAREATSNCLECHTTWFAYYPGTSNRYKPDSFLLGVTCERCHGPGTDHVAHHKTHPDDTTGAKIIAPATLSRERQLDICAQCHSNAIREIGQPFTYRPGQPLDQAFKPIHTKYPEDDHVANQIKGLRQSKCFQKDESLTCATCHNPHKPHEPGEKDAGAKSCAKCHKPADCKEQPKIPEAVRADCVGCHLPPRIWMNVNFHTNKDRFVPPIRRYDHRIAVHPESTKDILFHYYNSLKDQKSQMEAAKLRDQLVEYWTRETISRRENFRILAAIGSIREVLRIDPQSDPAKKTLNELIGAEDNFTARFSEANQKLMDGNSRESVDIFAELLKERPTFAMLEGKLGLALAMNGQNQSALEHLKRVGEIDPDEPYGHAMMGWLDFLAGRSSEAIKHLKKADEIMPFMAKTNFHLGLAFMQKSEPANAAKALELSLEVNPAQSSARDDLSQALTALGRHDEALIQARIATKLSRDANPEILLTLADAYAKSGDNVRFQSTCRKGLEIARKNNKVDLAVDFRQRLGEFKTK